MHRLDRAANRLCRPIEGTVGVEVGLDLGSPLSQGAAGPGDLRDRAGREGCENLSDEPALLFDAVLSLDLLAMATGLLPIVVDYVAESMGSMVATYVTQVMLGTQA